MGMSDREKVIRGLESCLKMGRLGVENCRELNCPYFENGSRLHCWLDALDDAIALLKEQEPKTGHWINSAGDDKCSVCGAIYSDLYPDYQHTHYCPNCGAKMIV